jgi:hypothetical protein
MTKSRNHLYEKLLLMDFPLRNLYLRSDQPMKFTYPSSLNNENHLLWKSQILPVLRGHGLSSFIDGSFSLAAYSIRDD